MATSVYVYVQSSLYPMYTIGNAVLDTRVHCTHNLDLLRVFEKSTCKGALLGWKKSKGSI